MLRSANEFTGYGLAAEDGDIGRCQDLLFDDHRWTVRYMVADTRKWLPGRKVLISPIALGTPDWISGRFPVRLTKAQIKEAPALDEHAPVSRQYERRYLLHYNWPAYWDGAGTWAMAESAAALFHQPPTQDAPEIDDADLGDPSLRSMNEVLGYTFRNESQDLGLLHDLIVEDGSWTIRHLVVDTGKWLPGRKVLIPAEWIQSVSWKDHTLTAPLSRETMRASPPFDPAAPVNQGYVEQLFDYYGRPSEAHSKAEVEAVTR